MERLRTDHPEVVKRDDKRISEQLAKHLQDLDKAETKPSAAATPAVPYNPLYIVRPSVASPSVGASAASASSSSPSLPSSSSSSPLSPSLPTTAATTDSTKKQRQDHSTAASTMATGSSTTGGGVGGVSGGDDTMTDVDAAVTHGDEDTKHEQFHAQ